MKILRFPNALFSQPNRNKVDPMLFYPNILSTMLAGYACVFFKKAVIAFIIIEHGITSFRNSDFQDSVLFWVVF